MSTQSNAMSESFQEQSMAPAAIPATQAFYWSVRRELWENRSIYVAPLGVAGLALLAFLTGSIVGVWHGALNLDPAQSREAARRLLSWPGRRGTHGRRALPGQ